MIISELIFMIEYLIFPQYVACSNSEKQQTSLHVVKSMKLGTPHIFDEM